MLNIKNAETHDLAKQLAILTGESLTEAVTEAVRERLLRLKRQKKGSLAAELVALGQDCAGRLKEPYRSASHDELLYGDDGLPR